MSEYAELEGQADLARRLRELSGAKLRRAALRGVTAGLRPMLAAARRLVPVDSGRLRASLGLAVQLRRRGDGASGRLGPRRDFCYTAKGRAKGAKRVAGTGKQREKALAKGYAADRVNPSLYARGIEVGADAGGRIRRHRGPAWFLRRALEANRHQAVEVLTDELRRHVDST